MSQETPASPTPQPSSSYPEVPEERTRGRGQTITIIAWVVGSIVSLGVLLYLTLGLSSPGTTAKNRGATASGENPLANGRSALHKQGDLATVRQALQQFNNHLVKAQEHQAPALSAEQVTQLQTQFGLDKDALSEIQSPTYTGLDAYHLESCFLLRDAARSLELPAAPGKPGSPLVSQTPLDLAVAAFSWSVRQVRLQGNEPEPVPPAFVLRRGWGTPLERALVFLGLLEQLGQSTEGDSGLQGCLIFGTGRNGNRLWACGVTIGDKPDALYLFDPYLGIPLPGPGGKGVATLAQVRNDPAVLGQLKIGSLSYDISPEQAKSAEVKFVCPLSALAPRIAILQNVLLREPRWHDQALPQAVHVRLAEDPNRALAILRQAVTASGGKEGEVSIWREGTHLLRRFLPPEDGGVDKGKPFLLRQLRGFTTPDDPLGGQLTRKQLYLLQSVPWENFPARFRDPEKFRYDLGLGQRLREIYADPFFRSLSGGESPRDLLLRGRETRAIPDLVKDLEHWRLVRKRLREAENLDQAIEEWLQKATTVYAQVLRAQTAEDKQAAKTVLEELWKGSGAVNVLLTGAAAELWSAELTWTLALCTQERAERLQARLDLANRGKGATSSDGTRTREVWEDARGWWREYTGNYPEHSGQAAARPLQARVLSVLGERAEAGKILRDPSGTMSDLERLGHLWLANQLEPQK